MKLVTRTLIAALALTTAASHGAIVLFNSGSVTYTLDPDVNTGPGDELVEVRNPMPLFGTGGGFSNSVSEGASTTSGVGTTGHLESPTLFGISFTTNTGVTQDNSGSDFAGAGTLRIDFTATFDITVSDFGPPTVGYANFPVIEWTVGSGAGAFVQFDLSATFTGGATRSPVSFSTGAIATAGSGSTSFFNEEGLIPNAIPAGTSETIAGYLLFTAYGGDGGSSDISLGAASGIPEPTTPVFAALSAVFFLRRRRH